MLSIWVMPCPSSGCFVMTKCVRQHKIVKGGKLQKSESSLICVIIAEGSTNALPVSTNIPAHFCIPGGWWWACWRLGDIPWQCSQCSCEQEIQHHARVYPLFHKRKPCVLPPLLFRQISSISFHRVQGRSMCTCPFRVLVPKVSPQLFVSFCFMRQWWCCLFHESTMMHQWHAWYLHSGVRWKTQSSLTNAVTDLAWYCHWFFSWWFKGKV